MNILKLNKKNHAQVTSLVDIDKKKTEDDYRRIEQLQQQALPTLLQGCCRRLVKGFVIAYAIRALVGGLPQLFRLKFVKFLRALIAPANRQYGLAGAWLLTSHEVPTLVFFHRTLNLLALEII